MKRKTLLIGAFCAAFLGMGIGMSSAQVPDLRCKQCDWNFYSCIQACDYEGGEAECYQGCIVQRRLCKATFCP